MSCVAVPGAGTCSIGWTDPSKLYPNAAAYVARHPGRFTKEPVPMPEPDVNPKELRAASDDKAPLEYLEPAGDVEVAYVMQHGAEKYGRRNYTVTQCKTGTYISAVLRHLLAIRLGEDTDPDSGRLHWAHIRACCDVVMGAKSAGMLVDDQEAYATPLSDRVHVDGDRDAKGLTAEYNRGIDELAEELTADAEGPSSSAREVCSGTYGCRIECPCRGADTEAPRGCVRKVEFRQAHVLAGDAAQAII